MSSGGNVMVGKTAEEIQQDTAKSAQFLTNEDGPENPIHSLDVFSRGLPISQSALNGFRRKQNELLFDETAMKQVLLGVDIRPTSLVMHPRAHLFPDQIEAVVFHTKSSLVDHSLEQLATFENFSRRANNHPYSYGLIADVAKANPRGSLVPYGILHPDSILIASETWKVRRKDQRAQAVFEYIRRKRDGPLPHEKIAAMEPEQQLNYHRFGTDFGQLELDSLDVEKQIDLAKALEQKQHLTPFLHTNHYRVNYYTTKDGDFFYADVLPSDKSSLKQWVEWSWLKTSQFVKRNFFGEKKDTESQPITMSTKQPGQ